MIVLMIDLQVAAIGLSTAHVPTPKYVQSWMCVHGKFKLETWLPEQKGDIKGHFVVIKW